MIPNIRLSKQSQFLKDHLRAIKLCYTKCCTNSISNNAGHTEIWANYPIVNGEIQFNQVLPQK